MNHHRPAAVPPLRDPAVGCPDDAALHVVHVAERLDQYSRVKARVILVDHDVVLKGEPHRRPCSVHKSRRAIAALAGALRRPIYARQTSKMNPCRAQGAIPPVLCTESMLLGRAVAQDQGDQLVDGMLKPAPINALIFFATEGVQHSVRSRNRHSGGEGCASSSRRHASSISVA